MRNIILKLLFILTIYTGYSQTIKPLSAFYTESQPNGSEDFINLVYYKDTNNYFSPFIGTWAYQNGTKTFIVKIWKETKKATKNELTTLYYRDEIFAHYKMVQNYGMTNETTLYSSETNFLNSPTAIPTIIYGSVNQTNKLNARIFDVNLTSNNRICGQDGWLTMTILGTNPITAAWKIDNRDISDRLFYSSEQDLPFIIPTNITLTKQ